jgi:Ca2+-binding EF-hand superfamily protein
MCIDLFNLDEIEPVLRAMYNLLGIKHVQDYPPEVVAKDIMKKLDTSNNGKISRDEFIHALMKDGAYRNMMNPFH